MGELVDYAKRELDMIEKDEDGMQERMNRDILEIIEKFSKQGHSGLSGNYAIRMITRLLRWKPLLPLTGEVNEWEDCYWGDTKQNKRCSSVFLNYDGTAQDIDGIVVSDDGGIRWYLHKDFVKLVTFPYTPPDEPERVYIEYKEDGSYDIITDDPQRIQKLREMKEQAYKN